ncbi:hypothetical protein AnigIFM63604_004912 [Aspergillus niger]|uniref:Uncharacterized protein n=1 Tax=Aspergillus niger TaxID=5061 RepID=A0A9W6AF71_ASPNG|nr:hypothetical protein AnigIFM63604_004912 [Aspergillus niger]
MPAVRPRIPTRVASHQNQNQTAPSTQALTLTSQFSAKRGSHICAMGGPVEVSRDSTGAGNGSEHRASPRASITSDEIDRLWRLAYHVSGRTRQ